ncbi:hypothetical protein F2P81_005784 [Scophthalmus maximus]|uniref:Uncharacterized protein n=1 Tax=Scophthalmus maximus TaxID=52904 RepID=A0A6A4TJK1_SCOMX|nr:hypothetical protein F2P81_005784 [Scophthalmus maximus]
MNCSVVHCYCVYREFERSFSLSLVRSERNVSFHLPSPFLPSSSHPIPQSCRHLVTWESRVTLYECVCKRVAELAHNIRCTFRDRGRKDWLVLVSQLAYAHKRTPSGLYEYKMKGVEEVKYMRGEENRVNVRNQENLEKSNVQYRGKQQKEVAAANVKSKPLSGGRVMKGQTDERRERWRRMRRPIAAHCREQRKGLVTFGS